MKTPPVGTICLVNVTIRQNPTSKIWGKKTRVIERIVCQVDDIPINENTSLRSRVKRELGIKTDTLIIAELTYTKIITNVPT